ncbi:MAG: hypothetical protein GF364_19500 [Candidatus Lokiarchaeota archaeon]|nr:hypothetical protein [Candidatus Lokiarchaeota archaeon]
MTSKELTNKERDSLKKEFNEFDINGDGQISAEDIIELLKKNDLVGTEEAINDFLKGYDLDGDHKITFEEYVTIYQRKRGQTLRIRKRTGKKELRDRCLNIFLKFDRDNSGTFNETELVPAIKDVLPDLIDDHITQTVRNFDISKDGVIDFDEFYRLIKYFLK